MNAHDSRLDPGVRAARRVEWISDDQWDDNNTLRPGFGERLAPYDPTPQYSRLDVLDGLPRPVRADSLRTPAPILPPKPHTGLGVGLMAVTVLLLVCAVIGFAAVGFGAVIGL